MSVDDPPERIGEPYAFAQLVKAFVTARSHADPAIRTNAEKRVDKWKAVLQGIASGRLRIGSRAPVAELPVWVTPEVVRGGFATGRAEAEGDLFDHEARLADQLGVPRSRRELFTACLSERGLVHLRSLLQSGRYRITIPEEGALLTVAWLIEHDDVAEALSVVETIEPYADRFCFIPRPGDEPRDLDVVSRSTVDDVSRSLAGRRPHPQVETMREALAVWNPFADELLDFWLEVSSAEDEPPGEGTAQRRIEAARYRERYQELATNHRLCTKHRNPTENLAALVAGLGPYTSSGRVEPRVRHAVESMVRRRGKPGSPEHRALREAQAANAAVPAHHLLAKVVVARLVAFPPDRGVESVEALVAPVSPEEARAFEIRAGAAMPPSVHRAINRAIEGTVDDLLARRLIPSAEVLARLVPQIAAATTAAGYPDQASQWLAAQTYLAFRNRRSLLLLNYEQQVRINELPWVRQLSQHRERALDINRDAVASLQRLAELTLRGFPATLVPNPLVAELAVLIAEAGMDVPLVEELAADIFMGSFSHKFVRSAKVAGELLGSSVLYSRYYGINYEEVAHLPRPSAARGRFEPSQEFAAICRRRARDDDRHGWSVARNGTIIEQAQILTTQNLAALIGPVGLREALTDAWGDLARRCFQAVSHTVAKVDRNPRPLSTVKDAAYAWRHMIFFLAMASEQQAQETLFDIRDQLESQTATVQVRLTPAIVGLEHVMSGGSLDDPHAPADARRFLGWVVGDHWILGYGAASA